MEIGVQIPHTGLAGAGAPITTELVRDWCKVADEAGFGVLWGFDHLLLPRHVDSKYIVSREPTTIADDSLSQTLSPNLELTTTMAFVAAVTKRIKIGSAVAVLTIRNALLNARQLATVDRYSAGRVLYGVGIGWQKEEADAGNMPWDRRGARGDEHISLMRTLWSAKEKYVEFHGEFWDIPPSDPEPLPVQRPIPILVGGHSEPAVERAARLGDGWITGPMSARRLTELLPLFRATCARHDRDPATLPIYSRGARGNATIDDLRRYEELGVHSLHVDIETLDQLKRFADEVLPNTQ